MEGGAMMEGGGMMEGEGGMVWWREGEHWSSPTWACRHIHFVVVAFILSLSVVGRCVQGCSSSVGDHCHPVVGRRCCLLVGHRLCVLEGCAGGGARRPSWFQRDGLSVVVGIGMGGGSSLPVGTCRSWVRGWGIVVVGRESLSVGGVIVHVHLWEVLVVATEQWWWWLPFVVVVIPNRSWLSWFGCC